MHVDREQFLDQGYLILRNVIAPHKLDEVRTSYEALVEKQKVVWARDRGPDDPPGGLWETHQQPRLNLESPGLVDRSTRSAVEVWLQETTLGVARQLLALPEATVFLMSMMCSPVRDHGPDRWHRDVHPIDMAPLRSLQMDVMENGPRYVQWNIALYDDNVLWIVPGSHRRVNTDEENRHLLENERIPLPGGIPVELESGDGVVYINYLLHWGSRYSPELRRTIHGGHAIYSRYPDLSFTESLAPSAREAFEGWARRSAKFEDITESALRAVINKDASDYHAQIERLQPGAGEKGKMVLTIHLCKAAQHIRVTKMTEPELQGVPERIRQWAFHQQLPVTLNWGVQFRDRFSPEEAAVLWERFRTLDAKLKGDEEEFYPGFQSGPMRYYFNEMAPGFGVEEFIASWDESFVAPAATV